MAEGSASRGLREATYDPVMDPLFYLWRLALWVWAAMLVAGVVYHV